MEVASGNPLRHTAHAYNRARSVVVYIIKKWLPRRRGVWTENKKIVRSILVYYSILEALLSLWYRTLCTKEWRVGVWDVKVVFHIYIIIFSPFFPSTVTTRPVRVTRDGRFSALSFFICFTFASARAVLLLNVSGICFGKL